MSNERIHLIIGDRQVGKTTKLIKESAEKQAPIIVRDKNIAKNIADRAKAMNLDIPEPIAFSSFNDVRNKRDAWKNGCLVDDIDFLIPTLFGIPIIGATANLVSFENTELLTIEGQMTDRYLVEDSKNEEK